MAVRKQNHGVPVIRRDSSATQPTGSAAASPVSISMPPGKRSVMPLPREIAAGTNVSAIVLAETACASRFRHQNSRWQFTPRERANAARDIPLAVKPSSALRATRAFQRFDFSSCFDRALISMPASVRQNQVLRVLRLTCGPADGHPCTPTLP